MKNKKITSQQLKEFVKKKALEMKEQLSEEFKNAGQAHEVKMNHDTKASDKGEALVKKTKTETKFKKGPAEKGEMTTDVDVNEQPSGEGSDEKIATAVEVEAGAAKSKEGPTKGQATAKFDSKKNGPKKEVSDPFVENGTEGKMNSMDKDDKSGAKTYVEAGTKDSSTSVTAGQHDAKFSERVPKSDKDERVAQGIQLKESYTKKELYDFILNESTKLGKKIILKQEIEKLKKEIGE